MTRNEGADAPVRSIFSDPTEEETLYFEMIDRAVQADDHRIISNGRPAHAVYILCKFLEIARERMFICTGRLSRSFDGVMAYEEPGLVNRAVNFLRRGGHLGIVVLDELDLGPEQTARDHPLLKELSTADIGSGDVKVSRYTRPLTGVRAYHFVVVDGQSVRLEVNTADAEAYVRLHDPESCAVLERIFGDRVLAGSELLSLPVSPSRNGSGSGW